MAEVPNIRMNEDHRNLMKDDGPYYIPNAPKLRNINKLSICTKLKAICRSTYDIIEEAYELQRRKATELLAFVISDTDRIHSAEHPNQIPIAYALKGYSLSTDALCNMVIVVQNKCKEHGIDILCEGTDGQWARNCMRAEDGSPSTRIQFQKDVWNKFVRNSKATLYNNLLSYSKVDKGCLEELSGLISQ